MSFLSGVAGSNGSIWPYEGPNFTRISVEWVDDLILLMLTVWITSIAI